jgi:predicted TIM-barrel fold metal-dependent hydrolase
VATPDPSAPGWDAHVHVFDAAAPARAGHYQPVHRPLADIEALAATHGIGHLVLVQPSVYGTDNRVLLEALKDGGGRHRGVAVVESGITDEELDALHTAGVRGVRFNRVSPAGHRGDVEGDLLDLAPRLRERGWHVQWYAPAEALAEVARLQVRSGLCFVLDHLAGLHAGLDARSPAWDAARALADNGAWIKLSGWYRLDASAPYIALQPNIERAVALFGPRCVWGSDWPHTSFTPGESPAYESTLAPLQRSLGKGAWRTVLDTQAPRLYAP